MTSGREYFSVPYRNQNHNCPRWPWRWVLVEDCYMSSRQNCERTKAPLRICEWKPDFQVVKQFITDHTCWCVTPVVSQNKKKRPKKGTSTTKFLLGFDKQWTTKKLHPYVAGMIGCTSMSYRLHSLRFAGTCPSAFQPRFFQDWRERHQWLENDLIHMCSLKSSEKEWGVEVNFPPLFHPIFSPLNKSITRLNQQVFSHFLEQG